MKIETNVPAKINLWLEVVRKRPDGYHDLSSLMLPVTVFDRISMEIRPAGGPVTISCDSPEIPSDERNLAWRAADLYLKSSGRSAGVSIHLEKNIPSGAGLGGGSSDAGGVLRALNSYFGNALSDSEMVKLAARLGADVPFFLYSKPALATGIGDILEFTSGIPEYPLILIKPPVSVPTAWVYQNLKLTGGRPQIKLSSLNVDPWQIRDLIVNDLESVTMARHPVIADLKDWLRGRGAVASAMSGSGPTVFGIFKNRQAADDAQKAAARDWPDCWVKAAEVIGGKI